MCVEISAKTLRVTELLDATVPDRHVRGEFVMCCELTRTQLVWRGSLRGTAGAAIKHCAMERACEWARLAAANGRWVAPPAPHTQQQTPQSFVSVCTLPCTTHTGPIAYNCSLRTPRSALRTRGTAGGLCNIAIPSLFNNSHYSPLQLNTQVDHSLTPPTKGPTYPGL